MVVDLSEAMPSFSRCLNPGATHLTGDMRAFRKHLFHLQSAALVYVLTTALAHCLPRPTSLRCPPCL